MTEQGQHRELVWLPTDSIAVARPRHESSVGDLDALAESIRRVGILQPLVVVGAKTHRLVFGRRRLAAARQAGCTQVPCILADDLVDAVRCLEAQRDENTLREPLSPTEMAALADELEPVLKKQAGIRQQASRAKPGQQVGSRQTAGGSKGGAIIAPPTAGKARKQLAAAVGTNPETLRQIRVMRAAADAEPVLYGHLITMMNKESVGAAWRHFEMIQAASVPAVHKDPQPAAHKDPEPDKWGCTAAWPMVAMLRRMKPELTALLAAPEGIDARHVEAIRAAAQAILDLLPEVPTADGRLPTL